MDWIMFAVVEHLGLQTASLLQKAGCTGVQLSNRLTLVDSVTVHFVWQVHGNCTENRKFLISIYCLLGIRQIYG